MGKNKLDAVTFCKILDLFGEDAANDTLSDVNEGKIRAETIEKYLYKDETQPPCTKVQGMCVAKATFSG